MANTYTQLYIQTVFAVQNRVNLIQDFWREELHKYIAGIVRNQEHKLIAVNSVSDHLHLFVGLNPKQSISNFMQEVKQSSSKWINEKRFVKGKFSWQSGYGAFSYSHSHINDVVVYIARQEEHHKTKTFREEYLEFLDKFDVPYDERYILNPIEE